MTSPSGGTGIRVCFRNISLTGCGFESHLGHKAFMIKTVLFDIDGVVVLKKIRFSQRFSNDFGIPIEEVLPFFENEFGLCLIGKADLKEELKKYLARWNWQKTADELLEYWLSLENAVSEKIIDSVKKLRASGIKCFLNTNNEKYRVKYLLENIGLKKYFDGIFSSGEIGYTKSQQEFWQTVYSRLGTPDKKTVLVWDDDEKNIQSAKNFGFLAEPYTDFNNYKNKINNIIK